MISSIHIRYKTIVYTSTLVLIMLDNEGQDLLNFILSQHMLRTCKHDKTCYILARQAARL